MNMHTKLSDKGQIVVPKAVRDRLGWQPGADLDVIETGEGVAFRLRRAAKTLGADSAAAALRSIYRHEGPPVSLDEMRDAVALEAAERFARAS